MKLSFRFCRLPFEFDADRLADEVAQFDVSDWVSHPSAYAGNSAIRLISVGGHETDMVGGEMLPTAHLRRCPYIRQVLASFGVVWSRSRLMRLAPGASVPEHCDINYHWFHRVRVHIPVQTHPSVTFRCADEKVHMAAGEAWLFDNWRLHEVRNNSPLERVHLVADTCGTADFWQHVDRAQTSDFGSRDLRRPEALAYRTNFDPPLATERFNIAIVMPPAEVEQLANDLLNELDVPAFSVPNPKRAPISKLIRGFCQEWRSVWSSFGNDLRGWPHYARLRTYALSQLKEFEDASCCSNGVLASEVFIARILNHAFSPPDPADLGDRLPISISH